MPSSHHHQQPQHHVLQHPAFLQRIHRFASKELTHPITLGSVHSSWAETQHHHHGAYWCWKQFCEISSENCALAFTVLKLYFASANRVSYSTASSILAAAQDLEDKEKAETVLGIVNAANGDGDTRFNANDTLIFQIGSDRYDFCVSRTRHKAVSKLLHAFNKVGGLECLRRQLELRDEGNQTPFYQLCLMSQSLSELLVFLDVIEYYFGHEYLMNQFEVATSNNENPLYAACFDVLPLVTTRRSRIAKHGRRRFLSTLIHRFRRNNIHAGDDTRKDYKLKCDARIQSLLTANSISSCRNCFLTACKYGSVKILTTLMNEIRNIGGDSYLQETLDREQAIPSLRIACLADKAQSVKFLMSLILNTFNGESLRQHLEEKISLSYRHDNFDELALLQEFCIRDEFPECLQVLATQMEILLGVDYLKRQLEMTAMPCNSTPLMLVASSNSLASMKFLLDKIETTLGTDYLLYQLSLKNNSSETAFAVACRSLSNKDSGEIAHLLLDIVERLGGDCALSEQLTQEVESRNPCCCWFPFLERIREIYRNSSCRAHHTRAGFTPLMTIVHSQKLAKTNDDDESSSSRDSLLIQRLVTIFRRLQSVDGNFLRAQLSHKSYQGVNLLQLICARYRDCDAADPSCLPHNINNKQEPDLCHQAVPVQPLIVELDRFGLFIPQYLTCADAWSSAHRRGIMLSYTNYFFLVCYWFKQLFLVGLYIWLVLVGLTCLGLAFVQALEWYDAWMIFSQSGITTLIKKLLTLHDY